MWWKLILTQFVKEVPGIILALIKKMKPRKRKKATDYDKVFPNGLDEPAENIK